MLNILLFVFAILGQAVGYLSTVQVHLIQSIISNSETPPIILKKTKQILYRHYYPWALKETKDFLTIHKKAVRSVVKPHSMQLYAMHGFSKAISNYNGSSPFHIYAKPYIFGELYKGLTESTLLKPYSHSQIMSQKNLSIIGMKNRRSLISYENYWTFDKLLRYSNHGFTKIDDSTRLEDIHDLVDSMGLENRHIFYLRYHYYDLTIRYPVRKICELLCISPETYRKRMNYVLEQIRNNLPN